MPVIFQQRIYRADLQANRKTLYLFGDNTARSGYGGQAEACRGEPNAVGIVTKHNPSTRPGAFFDDRDFERNTAQIDRDLTRAFDHLHANPLNIVVIPLDGIGTGLSDLAQRAPRTFAHLQFRLQQLVALGDPTAPLPRKRVKP